MAGADLMTVTSADGTAIGAWRSGAGPPLVLVHGTGADHARWAGVLPALAARFTVLAVDRRGRGASGDAAPYAIEREFEDLAAVVDAAGEGARVVAHSYGATCAMEAALLTGGVGRMVLYEPPLGEASPSAEAIGPLEDLLARGDLDAMLSEFMITVAGRTAGDVATMRSDVDGWAARRAVAHTIPRELRADDGYRLAPSRFRGLGVPALLLRGGDTRPAFVEAVERAHAALPGSRVAVMPGQGHAAMDTGRELFLAEVLGFLGG